MSVNDQTEPDDELPELNAEYMANGMYIDPKGPCKLVAWIDYNVIWWLMGLEGDFNQNVNEILKEKMQQSVKPE